MTILGMKPLRHGERLMLSRETKPLIRSLGLEPIHFTVLLLKNSAVIEEGVIVMKKINRTLTE